MSVQTSEVTVGTMTVTDLKALIRDTVEEVLLEILSDPDAGLELDPEFERQLRESVAYAQAGGKMLTLRELAERLEIGGE